MITLRPATLQDAIHLYVWRNDPVTRAMFRDTAWISWESHRQWLRDVLEDINRRLFVAERDGTPVGTIRFDIDPSGDAEVSVTAAPETRGGGVGAEIIRAGTAEVLQSRFVGRIVARIKMENIASQKAFAKAGYAESARTESEVVMLVSR